MLREIAYSYRPEAFVLDGRWFWDYAVKFTRWQHPAVGYGTRFAVCSD